MSADHNVKAAEPIAPDVLPEMDAVVARMDGLLSAVVGDQLVLLDGETGRFDVLSTGAALVYTSIDGSLTVDEIIAELQSESNADPHAVAEGVRVALGSLHNEGLVDFGDDDGATASTSDGSSDTSGLTSDMPVDTSADARDAWRAERKAMWDVSRLRRLDAAEWSITHGPLQMGGAVVEVRMGSKEMNDHLVGALAILPPADAGDSVDCRISVTGGGAPGPYRVFFDGECLTRTTSGTLAAEMVLSACNQAAALFPTNALRFHAGVVERDGKAVMVCGASGHGKSSLTTALVKAGWGYITDEVGVVDHATGVLTPFAKWIDLNSDAMELLGIDEAIGVGSAEFEHHVPPTAVGKLAAGPAKVVAVVVLNPTPNAAVDDDGLPFRAPVTGADAVLTMLPQVFAGTWDHPDSLQALADLCDCVSIVQMHRAPIDQMVAAVGALVDQAR